jgi:hypothetical protein
MACVDRTSPYSTGVPPAGSSLENAGPALYKAFKENQDSRQAGSSSLCQKPSLHQEFLSFQEGLLKDAPIQILCLFSFLPSDS